MGGARGRGAIGWAAAGARIALAFALPPRCPGCGAIGADDHHFCLACWQALELGAARSVCPRCGEPADAAEPCDACIADPPPWDSAAAAVPYGAIARGVAIRLKHGGRTGLAETVARQMARLILPGDPPPLVVPVPLHRWRLWRRGYNQAALIARHLCRLTGATPALDLLERRRATPMLRGLSRGQRTRTVKGAFAVSSRHLPAVKGARVILVDDVLTSGATAGACTRALKRAGAARVEVVTWARVTRNSDEPGDSFPV